MKICVIGLGYIGLPTAVTMANRGFEVYGCDIREDVVEKLASGTVHIEEPGLESAFLAALQSGRLHVDTKPSPADAYVIAVPTPFLKSDRPSMKPYREADLTYVLSAAEAILPHLKKECVVILESTSPPGTTRDHLRPVLERSGLTAGTDFYLAYSPERVLPGAILREIISNDRIIGGINSESARKAKDIYGEFVEGGIFETDCTTAEMVKLSENTYRDVNIALANELAKVCELVGSNVWDVVRLANEHPRVQLHQPGPGVGGHCIAVDPWFLVEAAPHDTPLIRNAREVNDAQPARVIAKIAALLESRGPGPILFLGVTYKANVDDMRESPCLEIIRHFAESGAEILVFDPHVEQYDYPLEESLKGAIKKARYVVYLVDHDEFKFMDPELLAGKVIFDTRHLIVEKSVPADAEVHLLGSATKRKV